MDSAGSQPPTSVLAGSGWYKGVSQKFQYYLDKTAPHVTSRWLGLAVFIILYALRTFFLQGFYIVTYALGIYNLNLLLGFLTPQVDPELEGPTLPSRAEEEFRPFVRRLPEFKAWYSSSKSFLYGFLATFFPIFDVPVFWPILLIYFLVLLFITMKRQIRHMIRHKYVPFDIGKKKYKGGKAPPKNAK